MITLLTGMPGAGKTAAMVDILRKLGADRPLFVHFEASERLRPEQKLLHDSLKLPHQPVDASSWHKEVPDGGILVIDEAQGVWRPRGPAAKVPEAIAALETHRHAGVDIYLTTQSPRLIDANVRGLVGRHVHIRDTGWLGRWWYEWPECNEGLSWKTCPVKKRYKLPRQVFDVYASANEHHAPVRITPKMLYFTIFILILLVGLVFSVIRILNNRASGQSSKPDSASSVIASGGDNQLKLSSSRSSQLLPDERSDFIPRISDRPWTAPAYDSLRQVVRLPYITGAICINDRCECFRGREKLLEVTSSACLYWAQNRPFNPYVPDSIDDRGEDRKLSSGGQSASAPLSSAAAAHGGASSVSVPML